MTVRYSTIRPAQGCNGRWYIDKQGGNDFSPTHLDYECEEGNLREVVVVREVEAEDEIQDGELVSFGSTSVNVWRLQDSNRAQAIVEAICAYQSAQ